MISHRFDYAYNRFPMITIEVLSLDGQWKTLHGKLDTGACVSLLGNRIAQFIGINDPVNGKKVTSLCAVNGQKVTGYMHRMQSRIHGIENFTFYLDFIIAPEIPDKCLLGRQGFVNRFDVTLMKNGIIISY